MKEVIDVLDGARGPADSAIETGKRTKPLEVTFSDDWFFPLAHRTLLKILVLQQYRNHSAHGAAGYPLVISAVAQEKGLLLSFKSRGRRIPMPIGRLLGDKFARPARTLKPGEATGLHLCEKIAHLHRGRVQYGYDEEASCNIFAYLLKSMTGKE
jgi:K+-sensing histidine kinase KdpD